jgi:carbamoyltransferase
MRILAFQISHDSSVCSINDGHIEFFCKEERLSRVKRDRHPFKSLDLYHSKNFGKIDHVLFLTPSNNEPDIEYMYKTYISKKFGVDMENFSSLSHHECHASIAFYNSGFSNALTFVIDRNGSILFANGYAVARESESVYVCSYPDQLVPIYKSLWTISGNETRRNDLNIYAKGIFPTSSIKISGCYGIVKVYEAATTLIGQNALENGKTMGLSSYGEDKVYDNLFIDNEPISNKFCQISFEKNGNLDTTCFSGDHNKIVDEITEDNYHYYANKAKQVQIQTQEQVLKLIQKHVEQTGINNVCIVGGYGLNIIANNYYLKNLPNVNFYFEPVADDTGIPIGAAFLKYRKESLNESIITPKDNFYHYYDEEIIEEGSLADITSVCDLLVNGKSVAIFDGNPEVGPRALGHRSILFDARNKNSKELINKVKKREWYRPFACVVLEEKFSDYFVTNGLTESKYMTVNFECKEHTKDLVPGVVHVDNTCRAQTVSEGFIYDILKLFSEKTKCPILLNTSLNLAGEPLIQTKQQAIEMLHSSELDAVYFVKEGRLVTKNEKVTS